MDPDELVLVVPRTTVIDGPGWRGVTTAGLARVLEAIEHEGRYEPRSRVEGDRAFKQIIPYLVLRDGTRYFLMRRTRAGGDARLHDRYSIGVGGHLNPGDGDVGGGLVREWREEIEASFVPAFCVVGLLNDDETDVGAVHLGIVYEADVAGREVGVREISKLSGAFAEPEEVAAVRADLETWSALVFDHLERRGD